MIDSRRLFLVGVLAGVVLRACLLPLPGTRDITIWKVWSFAAATDVAGMYGVGGTPPERRELHWQGEVMTVDYPPVALFELGLAGRLYRAFRPTFDDSAWLNVTVKLPGLVAEVLAIVLLYRIIGRHADERAARWCTLALWLNPAWLINGSALGYLDPQMAVPLTLAMAAAWRGRGAATGVLLATAILTKAQAAFAAPVIAAILFERATRRVRALGAMAAAASAVGAIIVAPFVLRGAWSNLVQGIERLASHDMLSAQAANIWWIVTWLLRVQATWTEWGVAAAVSQPVRILGINRVMELGYPNARVVGLGLLAVALAWACWRARSVRSLASASALAAWAVYAYAMLAAQVHENHLTPAVMLFAPAAALDRRYRRLFWMLSGIAALNLFLFYGLGRGVLPLVPRSVTVIDATLVLSVVNLATFGWFARHIHHELRTSAAVSAAARR